jgi:hypothetical protein
LTRARTIEPGLYWVAFADGSATVASVGLERSGGGDDVRYDMVVRGNLSEIRIGRDGSRYRVESAEQVPSGATIPFVVILDRKGKPAARIVAPVRIPVVRPGRKCPFCLLKEHLPTCIARREP